MAALQAPWADPMASPYLKDLPFRIELNRGGRIEMSPASNEHGLIQVDVAAELRLRPEGRVLVVCSIQTSDGVRVADVAWASDQRLSQFGASTPYPAAPDLCVEVMSPSNSWAEMHVKAGLYLQSGAQVDRAAERRAEGGRRLTPADRGPALRSRRTGSLTMGALN